MKHLFFGGIHPKYNKEMSKVVTTLHTIEPDLVVIPMVQHIGAPCTLFAESKSTPCTFVTYNRTRLLF